jgi:hypothetical protein
MKTMNTKIAFGIVIAIAIAATVYAQSAGEFYQRALVQENGVGNLQNAIELYQRAAKEAKDDRAMAALALMGAARCYERLGQNEAKKLYEQVSQAYPDQRAAAEDARTRLGAMQQGKNLLDEGQSLINQTRLTKLTDQVSALEHQRTDLMSRGYAVNHPDLITLTKQIGEATRALQMEAQRQGMIMIAPGMFARKRTDPDEPVQFSGIVTGIQLINPNVWVTVDVGNAKKMRTYRIKGTNPRSLVGSGIGDVKRGDTITVEGLASREDPLTVGFATITTADGQKFFLGNSNFP